MPKSKGVLPEQAAAGQRMKELRLRYGWKQAQIFSDQSLINAVESGRSPLDDEDLINAYASAFRAEPRTLSDYRDGLITADEFIVRAGVRPEEADPVGIPSTRGARARDVKRTAPWEHAEVEELLALTLVARGMPPLVANVIIRSERLKLRDYPSWPLRIAHMESVREAEDEDALLAQSTNDSKPTRASVKSSAQTRTTDGPKKNTKGKPSASPAAKGSQTSKKRS